MKRKAIICHSFMYLSVSNNNKKFSLASQYFCTQLLEKNDIIIVYFYTDLHSATIFFYVAFLLFTGVFSCQFLLFIDYIYIFGLSRCIFMFLLCSEMINTLNYTIKRKTRPFLDINIFCCLRQKRIFNIHTDANRSIKTEPLATNVSKQTRGIMP